jgi:hypothetical protein
LKFSLWLLMRRNGNDGDHRGSFFAFDFIGAVVPKDAVCAWSAILRVGLEDFLAMSALQ